jgi:predicted alpha/beta-fold hydrolase
MQGYSVLGRAPPLFPAFRVAFPWFGGDLQTIKNNLSWTEPPFAPERQTRLHLPLHDGTGDTLLGLLDRPPQDTGLPLLILIHGLTGCEGSRNIMTSAAYFVACGFPVLRLNLRGAGPSLGLCAEHYHAGRTDDLGAALAAIEGNEKRHGIVMAGVSLGGNALLKFAGEDFHGHDVLAVASACAPIDLKRAQQRIMSRRNALYHRYLITRMKADALTGATDKMAMRKTLADVHNVFDFDDRVVAPQNGFDGALDYYAKCSAQSVLKAIRVPALLIHARTDPWIPVEMYTERSWREDQQVSAVISRDGGHVGFHAVNSAAPWHNLCMAEFFLNAVHRASGIHRNGQ